MSADWAAPGPPSELSAANVRDGADSTRALVLRRREKHEAILCAQVTQVGSMRQCDTSNTRVITRYRFDTKLPVELRIPCDLDQLARISPNFPPRLQRQ
jgi:hypothetical protein